MISSPGGSKQASSGTVVQTVSSTLMNQLLQGGAAVKPTTPTQVRVQGQTAGVAQAIRVQGGQIVGGGTPQIRVQNPPGAATQQIRIQSATGSTGVQQIRVQGQPVVQQVRVQGQNVSGGQQLRLQGSNSVITLPKTGKDLLFCAYNCHCVLLQLDSGIQILVCSYVYIIIIILLE